MNWGVLDIVVAAIDPSGGLLATKKALDSGAEAMAANTPAEAISGTAEGPRIASEAVTRVCCNEYQIQDGFLLNTNTGAVWIYDKNSNSFKLVTKEETDLQKAANGLTSLLLAEELHTTKAKAFEGLHHTVKQDFEEKFRTMIKLLDPTV